MTAGELGADSAAGELGADSAAGELGADSAAGELGADSAAGELGADSAAGELGADSAAGELGADSAAGELGVELVLLRRRAGLALTRRFSSQSHHITPFVLNEEVSKEEEEELQKEEDEELQEETDSVESGQRQSQGEENTEHSQEQQAEEIEDGAPGIGQQEDVEEEATGTEQEEVRCSKSGVLSRLKVDFPQVRFIHCLAHRLELAVSDSLKAVGHCNHFEIFISKLYSIFSQSHKAVRLLSEAAGDLNVELLKIGQIFTIRWVASSFRTLRAVWRNYPALAKFFETESKDESQPDRHRKKYLGLLKYFTSANFLSDLGLMKDVLRELQSLSLKLQKRETTIVDSFQFVAQTIEVLTALKVNGGKSTHKAEQAVQAGSFKGVSLIGEGAGKISKQQFIQAVVDHLNARMPADDFVKMLEPLQKCTWPENRADLVLYGEAEVCRFAKLLGEPSREAVEQFRDYKLNGKKEGGTLKRLIIAKETYLATSAECERGFSALNDTDRKARNKLRVTSLAALLFVDINGPPVQMIDLRPFVESWVRAGHRLSNSWVPGRKAKQCQPRPLWSMF
ncbi:E3 SUMO-protein ligase KIAA1586-like [Engraulis encrasicolus]|uniref:E3 SUMO-protein ligase KIAA1586-like n=1 Tax=Engraulis encrasicolus TaxID=184585 RepID=UPI002FCEE008